MCYKKYDFKLLFFIIFFTFIVIFINVNPFIKYETKYSILKYIPNKYVPETRLLIDININNIDYRYIIECIILHCLRKNGLLYIFIRNSL